MGKKDNDVKVTPNLTPPILGGLLGVKSNYKATDGKNTAYGSSKTAAKDNLRKKANSCAV